MHYVFVDPSGSYTEGKGHTGISIIKDFKWDSLETISIAAKDYPNRLSYWKAVLINILKYKDIKVIIEAFTVRNNFLVGKMPETPLLIGALIWYFEDHNIPYTFQYPVQAKSRFKDDLLGKYIPNFEKRGKYYYLNNKLTNDHVRDSLKHLLYFMKYGEK